MSVATSSGEFDRLRQVLLKRRAAEIEKRQALAWQKAKAVASLLKEEYQVARVFLYGSLAWGGFHLGSDIDLLLEGFRGDYWRMYLAVERMADPFDVSLVAAEEAAPGLLQLVRKDGVEL